jgi:mannose-6-phosphate isomerase-like protein (cupin superfamily)
MSAPLPEVVVLKAEAASQGRYDNHPIAELNDHVVRISVMTEPYHWHLHPDSDETFLVLEGRLAIDFEEGTLTLGPGELITVPKGRPHRTRPLDGRSVNLTVEAADAASVAV